MTISPSFEKLRQSEERSPIVSSRLKSYGPFRMLGHEAYRIAEDNGWHRDNDTVETYIAGIAEEVGEANRAYRDYGEGRKVVTKVVGYDTVTGEPILQQPGKPEGIGPEIADIVIRALHLADYLGIDADYEIREKMRYNETRKFQKEFDN